MIHDIRFYGNKVYKLKKSEISSAAIEQQLSKMTYSGQGKTKDRKVENANIPYFALAFNDYVFEHDSIPTEEQLLDTYLNLNEITSDGDFYSIKGEKFNKTGVKNRMLRSYPSLIRDFHFFKLCQESKRFDNVKFSTALDIYEGIDLFIKHKELSFCVALYTDTKRAKEYKKRKNESRHDYDLCNAQIELVIDLSTKNEKIKTISNFKLLTSAYISEFENEMNKHVENAT